MIIYFFGPDSYRRQKNVNTAVKTYEEKYGTGASAFDMENEDDFFKFKDFCSQQSLFGLKKLGIIKNPMNLENKDNLKELKKILKDNLKNDDTTIIVSDENEPAEDFKFLLTDSEIHKEYLSLTDERLIFFIKKEAGERKLGLTQDALVFLAKAFKNNTWGLITELEKLEALDEKEKQKIEAKDLEKLISYFEEPNIFYFMDAVSKNAKLSQKIHILETLILNKEEPAKIFNILAARPFLNFELIKILADYDVAIKSGKMEYDMALFDMALN